MAVAERLKRVVLGRAIRTEQRERRFGRSGGIDALAGDALSSNAYATQEILIVLAVGGFGLYAYGPAIGVAVIAVFALMVAAYRHVVRLYPGGGADYEVAAKQLGARAAAVAGAAMLIDFALTLAVSVAAILEVLASLAPRLADQRLGWALALVALLTLVSLRGRSTSSIVLRIGTYAFVIAVLVMTAFAVVAALTGDVPRAASADLELADPQTAAGSAAGVALVLVLARSFASGCIAVTGIEAVGTGVPLFRKPRGENAAAALVVLAVVSMVLFACTTALALVTGVRVVADSGVLGGPDAESAQQTVVVQIAEAVFRGSSVGVWAVAGATVAILLAAALSAFSRFSALSSVIAADEMLPRQFMSRGDRLVHSNGIMLLGLAAGLLLLVFDASLTALIQLYVIGVFLALAIGQVGMVRHWTVALRGSPSAGRGAAQRALGLAGLAAVVAIAVLLVVLTAKLTSGAWVVLVLIPLLAWGMLATRQHYQSVFYQVTPTEPDREPAATVTALILVARIHKPTLRALSYARATRPNTVQAITVAVDDAEADRLASEWAERGLSVPLVVLDSPFREIGTPVMSYVAQLQSADPDLLLTIYIPEYVVDHWWQELLHNQSAARLKRRLMGLRNVVVVSVPWQVEGSAEPGPAEVAL